MDTGALVHAPSTSELLAWKAQRVVAGALLMVVAAVAIYGSVGAAADSDDAGGVTGPTLALTALAGAVIAVFALRYLLMGLLGRGVSLYERAVEADFFGLAMLWPVRRTVPLTRVRVAGTPRLTKAYAIASTGHEFPLADPFVQEADLWYLGSLGTRPIAPGGRQARERRAAGELEPEPRPAPRGPPDHGPAWPPRPPLPGSRGAPEPRPEADVEVEVPPVEEEPAPPRAPPVPARQPAASPVRAHMPPPALRSEGPPEEAPERPAAAPPAVPVLEELPEEAPERPAAAPPAVPVLEELPEEAPERPAPAPPMPAPSPPATPPPPVEAPPAPAPPEETEGSGFELEEITPAAEGAPAAGEDAEVASEGSGWELEEVPPPEPDERPVASGDWEEL